MKATHTARQVASELGVAERTVRRWIASGDLAAEKKSGAFLIDLDAARETFKRSRAGRSIERSSELAELRGRYLEVCDRLARAESELAAERTARKRFEAILYPSANDGVEAALDLLARAPLESGMEIGELIEERRHRATA